MISSRTAEQQTGEKTIETHLVLARLPQGVRDLCAVQRAHQLSTGESFFHREHLLVGNETVQYRLDAHAENLQKHARHPEGQQKAQKDRCNDTADTVVVQGVNDGQVAHKRGAGSDENLLEKIQIWSCNSQCKYLFHCAKKDSIQTNSLQRIKNDCRLTLPMTSTKVATRFTADTRRMFL